jgi:integrase
MEIVPMITPTCRKFPFHGCAAASRHAQKYNRVALGSRREGTEFQIWVKLDKSIRVGKLAVRERTLVLLDAATGLRVSELLALRWRDVDFENLELRVTRSIWH